ncbi:MAG: molybdate ABC transporter substrate-binding protein [Bacteroidota bacterium]
MKKYCFKVIVALLFGGLSACTSPQQPRPLLIATAANLQYAMRDLTAAFTAESGIACELILGSSGKLTAQIRAGAPYHVFLAADEQYAEAIFRAGLAAEPPETFAYGQLIWWSVTQAIPEDLTVLATDAVPHIAIAQPRTAPFGVAAVEALQYLKLYEALEPKLVYGESVAQANQFVTTGAATYGLTALSTTRIPAYQETGQWVAVDTQAYQPIEQSVVTLTADELLRPQAVAFQRFLFSAPARAILRAHAYRLPANTPTQ